MRDLARILSRISLITQLGLSLVTPPLLLTLGALWLQSHCQVGDWILLCAILVGLVSGVCSVWQLVRAEIARENRREARAARGRAANHANKENIHEDHET